MPAVSISSAMAASRSARSPSTALDYIASYDDLVRAFGTDARAGAAHYILAGLAKAARPASTAWSTSPPIATCRRVRRRTSTPARAFHHLRRRAKERARSVRYGAILRQLCRPPRRLRQRRGGRDHPLHHPWPSRGQVHDVRRAGLHRLPRGPDPGLRPTGGRRYGALRRPGLRRGPCPRSVRRGAVFAKYGDLRTAFGGDQNLATLHYIEHGFLEGRSDNVIGAGDFLF